MEKLILKGFEGVNELVSPELLKPTETPYFIDAVLTKSGSGYNPRKRGAWRRNGSFTQAGSTITGLKQLLDEVNNPYWVAYVGTKLQVYNSGWSDLKTGLTSGLNFKFVRYNDYNIVTNGVDNLFILGGTLFNNIKTLEIAKPDIVSSGLVTQHVQGSYGQLSASSQYKYILVYASDDGDFSPPSIPFTHYIDGTRNSTNSTSKALYLGNLPISSDGRVTKKYLFRTEGNGKIYYLRKILENNITYFEDYASDGDLDFSQSITYINVPLFGKHIAVHRDRLFIANIKYEDLNVYEPVYTKNKGSTTTLTTWQGYSRTYEDGQVPSVTPAASSGSGQLQGNSHYKWRVDFIDIYGRRSKYYIQYEYNTGTTVYNYYTLTHIPECNVGASNTFNPECYKKRIWRTPADSNTFYLLTVLYDDSSDISGTGTGLRTSYQDNTPDSTLITRQIWTDYGSGQVKTNPSAFAFSEIGKPTVIPLENYREVFADEGGEITGIFDDVNGLLIFKSNAIFKLYTEGSPVNWRLVKLIDGKGCTDPNSLVQINNTYFFKDKNRVYEFNSGGDIKEISEKFRTSIERIVTVNDAVVTNEWYWMLCQLASSTVVYAYDRLLGTWYTFTKTSGQCLAIDKFTPTLTTDVTFYSNYGGYVVNYSFSSEVDNETGSNAEISPVIYSKYFTFPDAIMKARLRQLFIEFTGTAGKSVTVQLYDVDTGLIYSFSPTVSNGWQIHRNDISTVMKPRILQIRVSGSGINELGTVRLDYRPIKEGYG
jgi:hypothetical protein